MLTAATVSSAKPALKAYKISDGCGLYLQVMTNGSRLWRLKYRVDMDGRRAEKLLSLGPYPRSAMRKLALLRRQCGCRCEWTFAARLQTSRLAQAGGAVR
ncbi:MAG: Arm DNA-binding domain-containing protein [Gammaproteobacteria bacterium]|nr:Arm DNA-binding domain-containing protein [Gammaproteobacteria bacterium]